VRNVYPRDTPRDETVRVYVAGQVATVLRFQQPCDPARTRMLAWEGRFEPVVCAGKTVLLVPLQSLEPEDRFMLLVTLTGGWTPMSSWIVGSSTSKTEAHAVDPSLAAALRGSASRDRVLRSLGCLPSRGWQPRTREVFGRSPEDDADSSHVRR